MNHQELMQVLYKQENPKYEDIEQYIEISKVGGHFSLYCLGKYPNEQTVIQLYNNNQYFNDWCNKYRDITITFIEQHHLTEFANIFINKSDRTLSLNFLSFTLKHNKVLNKIIIDNNKREIYQILDTEIKIRNYFNMLDILQQKQYINYILRKKNANDIIKIIVDNCKDKNDKNRLKSAFMFNGLQHF